MYQKINATSAPSGEKTSCFTGFTLRVIKTTIKQVAVAFISCNFLGQLLRVRLSILVSAATVIMQVNVSGFGVVGE